MSIINGSAMQGATRGFYPKTIEGSLRFNDDDSAYLSATHADGGEATYTLSLWAKRSTLGISDAHIFGSIGNSGDDYELIRFNSSDQINWQLRDNTLQGNVTTNAVFRDTSAWYHLVFYRSGSTVKIYVNGVEQSITTGTAFSATTQWANNNAYEVRFGVRTDNASGKYDGYLAEVFFIDGTAHNADAFGETKNGVWVPKNVTATDFTMGTNGFHLTFQDDAEVEAFNTVLWRGDGATKQSITGMGFQPDLVWVKQRSSGNSHILFDAVRGFGNGNGLQSQNTAAEGTNDPSYGFVSSADADGFTVNEGTVNDDYVNASGQTYVGWAWDAGANNASTGHSSVTWTGNGGTQSITGMGFKPDLVWIKNRDNADNHYLFDAVRGAFNGLNSDTTSAEVNSSNDLSSFDSDGFSIGSDGGMNRSGQAYVAWGWDAGDGDPVSNTDGSITSTVKASTTNGFSIVSYTGTGANATVGHGLSSAPDWVLVKDRDNANDWIVWHSGLADGTQHLKLNATENSQPNATYWNSTVPSSSVISLGNNSKTNGSSQKFIAYCWTETTGVSKFGSYTGTGATGNAITTGFKPAFVLIKQTNTTSNWWLFDNTRSVDGNAEEILFPNSSSSELTGYEELAFLSNGFEPNVDNHNTSGGTYIYAAFADTREAAFWLDQSGNDNDWQPVNLDHNDTVADSPTNNFCTMNPIAKFGTPSAFTLADGNLDLTFTSTSGNDSAVGTMGLTSGKWYHEVTLVSHADDSNAGFTTAEALATETTTNGAAYYKSVGYHRGDRAIIWGTEPTPTQRFTTLSDGSVLGFALDLDSTPQTLKIYLNGGASPIVDVELPTDKGDTWIPCCGDDGGDAGRFIFNFGQQPFKYDPPA